jgi:uncharacterized membrane protein YgdD (TMEM256/DUF423 family)
MSKKLLSTASVLGATSIILGAFGAHYLKARLTSDQLQTFETGVRYHIYHALALLALAFASEKLSSKFLNYAFWCFVPGICLFSGSIYLLSTKTLVDIEGWSKFLGPITPFGGLLLISGWIFIFIAAISSKSLK